MGLRQATLGFLIDEKNNKILLGMKKRGFGVGKYNGFGGKPKEDESVVSSLVREMQEECGVIVNEADLQHYGVIDFFFPHKPDWDQQVHIFTTNKWTGVPEESEEMKPFWFETNKLPFDSMWVDDPHWLPHVLAKKKVKGTFTFGTKDGEVLSYKIDVVDSL